MQYERIQAFLDWLEETEEMVSREPERYGSPQGLIGYIKSVYRETFGLRDEF